METIDSKSLDQRFKYDVAAHPGGENIKLCFACGTCTAGCPVSEVDDEYNPRKIIRQTLLGMREEVLSSPVIWRCVQCYSCTAKCPQNVKFTDIMGVLRDMAVRDNYVHPSFLKNIDEIDRLSQHLRHQMVRAIFSYKKKDKSIDQKELLKKTLENLTKE